MTDKPDVSKLRDGDVVLVRGTIIENGKSGPLVRVDTLPGLNNFHHSRVDIVSVEPCPLKVGDRVRTPIGTMAEVLCVVDAYAWVRPANESPFTYGLSQLSPA